MGRLIDREKVVKGLEVCTKPGTRGCFYDIKECPYDENGCRMALMRDALALMKEQEAVAVHDPGAFCPQCGWMLYPEDHPKFCGNCGQTLKWELLK